MPYVLRSNQDRAQLVGPFDTPKEAVAWATSPANYIDDRWSLVANPEVAVYDPLDFAKPQEIYFYYSETTITLEN